MITNNKLPANIEKFPCRNTSLSNIRNEQWKPISGFEESYHISCFGRVKSLPRKVEYANGKIINLKEKIILAGIMPTRNYFTQDYSYQLAISLHRDGKSSSFSVARLVYYHFVKEFDWADYNLNVVAKNGLGLRIKPDNLLLMSGTQKQERIYRRHRNITCFNYLDMKALAKKGVSKRMRTVSQYDLKGKKIRTYKSIKEAFQKTGIAKSSINIALAGRQLKAGNFIWRYGNGTKNIILPPDYFTAWRKKLHEKRKKKITQYDLDGNKIKIYCSISDAAAEIGISFSNISSVLHNRIKSAKGYYFRFGTGKDKIDLSQLQHKRKAMSKSITQYTLKGKLLKTHTSITNAAAEVGLSAPSLSAAARGITRQSAGFIWKFS